MRRILSAVALLPVVIGTIRFLPPVGTLLLAEVLALLAFLEYARLADRLGGLLSRSATAVSVMAVCAAVGGSDGGSELVLMAALVVFGGLVLTSGVPGPDALQRVSASCFPLVYLGLPFGALVAIRVQHGWEALLTLLITVMVSDTVQYYGGRLLGRRLLAPAISPKKTVEGAAVGVVGGTVAMVWAGRWWLPAVEPSTLWLLGAAVVVLGITGDLFESFLKRGAGVKDASGLIPGHGGVLDRVDALLFAAPVYYVFLRQAS